MSPSWSRSTQISLSVAIKIRLPSPTPGASGPSPSSKTPSPRLEPRVGHPIPRDKAPQHRRPLPREKRLLSGRPRSSEMAPAVAPLLPAPTACSAVRGNDRCGHVDVVRASRTVSHPSPKSITTLTSRATSGLAGAVVIGKLEELLVEFFALAVGESVAARKTQRGVPPAL